MILVFPPSSSHLPPPPPFPTKGLQVPTCPAPPVGAPPLDACALHTGSCSPFEAGPASPQLWGGGWRATLPAFEFCREKRAWRPLGHAPRRTRSRVTLVTASRLPLIGPDRGGRAGSETPRLLRALAPVSRARAEQRAGQPGRRLREEAALTGRGRRRAGPAACGAQTRGPRT